jgi:hypothetical protein
MRGRAILSLMTLAWLAVAAASDPPKARIHGYAASGTVVSVDESSKTFVVKSPSGRQTHLSWTDATVVIGGTIAVGQKVTLRYLDRDRKHIATSVRIGPSPTPSATTARAITPSPAPTPPPR